MDVYSTKKTTEKHPHTERTDDGGSLEQSPARIKNNPKQCTSCCYTTTDLKGSSDASGLCLEVSLVERCGAGTRCV